MMPMLATMEHPTAPVSPSFDVLNESYDVVAAAERMLATATPTEIGHVAVDSMMDSHLQSMMAMNTSFGTQSLDDKSNADLATNQDKLNAIVAPSFSTDTLSADNRTENARIAAAAAHQERNDRQALMDLEDANKKGKKGVTLAA